MLWCSDTTLYGFSMSFRFTELASSSTYSQSNKSAKLAGQRSTIAFGRRMCHRLNDKLQMTGISYAMPNILLFERRLHGGQIQIHFSKCGYRFSETYLRNYNYAHLKFNKRYDPHNGVCIWSAVNNFFAACSFITMMPLIEFFGYCMLDFK